MEMEIKYIEPEKSIIEGHTLQNYEEEEKGIEANWISLGKSKGKDNWSSYLTYFLQGCLCFPNYLTASSE
ncbi:MAG: hypothetical protein FGF52_02150 [Candidatus Brockarchaeota archaeon]|nr:hypothetical protein [Candidatus Brockarchaeota archaeon]